jgi:hypothetical protein
MEKPKMSELPTKAIFERTYEKVRDWANSRGIQVREASLAANKAGKFDGKSVSMNSAFSAEERLYYLAHSLGSIVRWSLSREHVQHMFDELRDAKKNKEKDPARLERALADYQAFETESSRFAVQLLKDLEAADVLPAYTNFMRADLAALTIYHRRGEAPVWRDFFAGWNAEVASGRISILQFRAKRIPAFTPIPIETQEILQKQAR